MSLIVPDFEYRKSRRAQFDRDGYLIFPRFLSPEGLARCQRECDAMLARRHEERPPEMIISAHLREPWLFELACAPALLDIIEAHIGTDILLWSSHLLCKPPGDGRSIPWHQDESYFNLGGKYPPTLWVAFDDIDEQNGGLCVLPGMHRHGLFTPQDSGRTDFDLTLDERILAEGGEPVPYRMHAGQLAMHDARLPHCSPPNLSDRWRRVVTFSYIAADAELAGRTYRDYVTDEAFERQFFLVRGAAPAGKEFPRSPFEIGDTALDRPR